VIYKDGFVSLMMGDKVFAKVKADKAGVPADHEQLSFQRAFQGYGRVEAKVQRSRRRRAARRIANA